MKCYPDIQLHLKVSDRILDPIHDGVDFLIHINDNPIEALVNVKLGHVKSLVCASPDFLSDHKLPSHPDDLKNLPCICLGENLADSRWRFSKNNQQTTVQVAGTYLVNHSEMRRDAIEQGLGIGSLPDYIAEQGIKTGKLIALLEDWQLTGNYQGYVCLQYVQSKYLPNKSRVFIDFMKQRLLTIQPDL